VAAKLPGFMKQKVVQPNRDRPLLAAKLPGFIVQPNRDRPLLAANRDSASLRPELDLGEDEVRGVCTAAVMPALAHTRKWQTVKHNTLGPKI
jgi:hypothetical protein